MISSSDHARKGTRYVYFATPIYSIGFPRHSLVRTGTRPNKSTPWPWTWPCKRYIKERRKKSRSCVNPLKKETGLSQTETRHLHHRHGHSLELANFKQIFFFFHRYRPSILFSTYIIIVYYSNFFLSSESFTSQKKKKNIASVLEVQ
jgi:hypothetical protein